MTAAMRIKKPKLYAIMIKFQNTNVFDENIGETVTAFTTPTTKIWNEVRFLENKRFLTIPTAIEFNNDLIT